MKRAVLLVLITVLAPAGNAAAKQPKPVWVYGACNLKITKRLDGVAPNPTLCKLRWNAATLIGLPEKQATQIAEAHGNLFRVVAPLKPNEFLTADDVSWRIDVKLRNGRVYHVAIY
jgi:hypothetical protein